MTITVDLDGYIGTFRLRVAFERPMLGVTALLGPSGSGKTSLLRAIAGLDRIAGAVTFDGNIWQDRSTFEPPERRRIGYMFQGIGLLPHLSVGENLDYAARRAPAGRFRRAEIIARTGISHLLDRKPAHLSGGEGQRAGIARALISQPRLLLMDEPLSALDGPARSELLRWLAQLLPEIAVPVFYVTHDETEAARLSTLTLRVNDGALVQGASG